MDLRTRPMGRRDAMVVLLAGAGLATGTLVAAAVEVGQKAPDFTLPGTTGEKISLSQFRGKQLLLLEFYVHDFGPT
jgi:cytochrome oxidase Cu insertion factor (SCO1/SenC/PrrC family)